MGGKGLAIKIVALNIASTNLMGWLLARRWRWSYSWLYQLPVLALPLGLGAAVKFGVVRVWYPQTYSVAILLGPMLSAAVLFAVLLSGGIVLFPSLLGLSRSELTGYGRLLRQWRRN